MSTIDDGGPAKDKTLRDELAMAAMIFPDVWVISLISHTWASQTAYYIADRMLAARKAKA